MGQEIGQESRHQPAVVFAGDMYHMVFSSNGDDNRILYATSPDGGFDNWTLGPDTGQTSWAAPALTEYKVLDRYHLLVLVFVANDPSNRILWSILDLNDDPSLRGWRFMGQVGGESAHAVSAFISNAIDVDAAGPTVTVIFTANDPTNRLLESQFFPA